MRPRELLAIAALTGALAGCNERMALDGHARPLEVRREPPEGTIARETRLSPPPRPAAWTRPLLERGREQYAISCVPCHGPAGYGDGMVVKRGFLAPPSYHTARLREVPDQHLYDVITQGYGAMYAYADRVAPDDRWAIVGYIRALQLSQNARPDELTTEDRKHLPEPGESP